MVNHMGVESKSNLIGQFTWDNSSQVSMKDKAPYSHISNDGSLGSNTMVLLSMARFRVRAQNIL